MKNIQISWEDFYKVKEKLIKKIQESGKEYKYIVTIPGGGLVPSYCLSKALNLPVVTINIKSYLGKGESGEIQHNKIEGFRDEILNQEDALIIDDMFDSGQTIKYLQNLYPNVDTAVIYARYDNHTVTYVGEVLGHDAWLDFPWEILCENNNY